MHLAIYLQPQLLLKHHEHELQDVNNVLKHASAKTLIVNILMQSDGIKILIKDNGDGFDVSNKITQNSLGLKTMAERISMLKGSFAIKSKRKEGTTRCVLHQKKSSSQKCPKLNTASKTVLPLKKNPKDIEKELNVSPDSVVSHGEILRDLSKDVLKTIS